MAASDKQVSITITARDGAKQTFTAIAEEATTMGQAISRGSASAATAIDATNTKAKEMSAALQKVRQDAEVFGQMLGQTVVAGLQAVAAAGVASQRAIDQLAQAVTDAGQDYGAYKTALDAAAAAGQQYGLSATTVTGALQTLVSVTQDTAASINLIGLAEDISAAKHISLASAAQLVGRVYDGNVGILKRYGIVLDAGTTSTEALAILQQRYNGQAEAGATTLSRYTAEVTNWAAAAGRAIGPFSGLIQVLPGLSAGFQLAEAGGKLLVDAFKAQGAAAEIATAALEAQTAAAGEAAVAEAGMSLGLLGPIGLVAGLSAAAAYLLFFKKNADDYAKSMADAATATKNLKDEIAGLQSGGQSQAAADATQVANQWKIAAANITLYKQLASDIAASGYAQAAQDIYAGQVTAGQTPDSSGIANAEEKRVFDEIVALKQLQAQLADTGAGWDAFNASEQAVITNDIGKVFATQGVDADAAAKAMGDLIQKFDNGQISAAAFIKQMNEWATHAGSDFASSTTSASAAVNALNDEVVKLQDSLAKGILNQAVGGLDTKPIQDVIAAISSGGTTEAAKAYQTILGEILNGISAGTYTAAEGYNRIIELGGRFTGMLGNQAAAAEAAGTATGNMTTALNAEAAAYAAAYEAAHDPAARLLAEGMAAQAASVAMYGFADSYVAVAAARAHLANLFGEQNAAAALDQQAATQFGPGSVGAQGSTAAANQVAAGVNSLTDAYNQMGAASIANGAEASQAATAQTAAITAANTALQGYIDKLGAAPSFAAELGALGDLPAGLAAGASQATTALNDVYGVIVGGTDAIAKQSDQIMKWADDLIGAEGVYSKLDDLVNKGLISGKSGVFTGNNDYANAQKAYNEIAKDNEKIQEDVLAIQAKQAPVLADLLDKQEQYVASIEKLPADQQLAALGFMDTTESMRAQSLVALAASAAMGQLGDTGKASTAKIIQGAAEADPALEAMLASMGLISQGADGTITVNFPTGETVQEAIDGLQTSINNLIGLEYTIAVHGDLSAYYASIGGIDGTTVGTVYVNIAPGTVSLPSGGAGSLYQLGGVVRPQSHASGGVASWLAEAGPEFLDFPNGGHGMAYSKGVYSVPEGTYVHTAPATKAMGRSGGAPQNFYGPLILQAASGDLHAELNRSAITRNRRA